MCAFYEDTGPTRNQVVDLLLQKYEKKYNKLESYDIKSILQLVIPEDKKDFGSWKCWITFGLHKNLVVEIEKKLELELEKKNNNF